MKRNIGIGDGVYGLGWLTTFVFVLLCVILKSEGFNESSWPLVNGIIMLVLIAGAGALYAFTLLNPKIVNALYFLPAFLILLHIAQFQVLMPYKVPHFGMPFYVFVGALLMGVGTYIIQQGAGAIMGEKKGK